MWFCMENTSDIYASQKGREFMENIMKLIKHKEFLVDAVSVDARTTMLAQSRVRVIVRGAMKRFVPGHDALPPQLNCGPPPMIEEFLDLSLMNDRRALLVPSQQDNLIYWEEKLRSPTLVVRGDIAMVSLARKPEGSLSPHHNNLISHRRSKVRSRNQI